MQSTQKYQYGSPKIYSLYTIWKHKMIWIFFLVSEKKNQNEWILIEKKGKILKYLKFLSWKRKGWLQFILYFRQNVTINYYFFLFIYKHELIGHLNAPFVRFCNNQPSLCRLPFIPGVILGIYYFQKWKDAVIIRYTNSKTFVQNYIIMNISFIYIQSDFVI